MRIQITGWSSEGLRCPDLDIDLQNGKDLPKVSLIQMPNGTGKTTTLVCLRACFDGSAVNWTPDEVRNFFAPGAHRDQASFSTRLLLNESKLLTITLHFTTLTASSPIQPPAVNQTVKASLLRTTRPSS